MRITMLVFALSALVTWPLTAQAPRIYISADMEGVAGVVTGAQLGPSGFEYERFRRFMTDEVNAAIDAARAAGAGTILVSDSHGNGQNLLLELLPEDVMVVRSWPRSLAMMAGIDSTFDGVIFIGYHASTTNMHGVRAHTMSSANLTAIRLNGQAVPEAGLNAAIAGHFGVPVIMVSGDDAAVEETRHVVGDVEGAVVKWNYGFHSARTLTPGAATDLIAEKVGTAMGRLDDFEPVVLEGPIRLEVSFKNYMPVEVLGYLPNVERIDSHTIRFVGKDMIETSRFLTFIMEYEPGLTP
jgi:D-amino peptidase